LGTRTSSHIGAPRLFGRGTRIGNSEKLEKGVRRKEILGSQRRDCSSKDFTKVKRGKSGGTGEVGGGRAIEIETMSAVLQKRAALRRGET